MAAPRRVWPFRFLATLSKACHGGNACHYRPRYTYHGRRDVIMRSNSQAAVIRTLHLAARRLLTRGVLTAPLTSGTVSLRLDLDFSVLDDTDRAFVLDLIDTMRAGRAVDEHGSQEVGLPFADATGRQVSYPDYC